MPNGVRIEERVMAHRAGIAGGSIGQRRPDHRVRRRMANSAPARERSFARTSACSLLWRQELQPARHDGSSGRSETLNPMRY
jgi:hypothetical protein